MLVVTGYWPRYSASTSLPNESLERVYQAAKLALRANEFALVRDEKERGVVMGEHRPTLFYWNVMAGSISLRCPTASLSRS